MHAKSLHQILSGHGGVSEM